MSFVNNTRCAAIDVPMPDPAGREMVIAIVKATFDVLDDGRCVPAEHAAPIRMNDVPHNERDADGSLRYPTDVCIEKRGTDVIVVGEAVSKVPVTSLDLAVKVRTVTVPLRVHGERVFYQGLTDIVIGPAAPFERKPVVYEKAYGGMSEDRTVVELRNPAGVGVAKRKADLVDRPAPQIEHPARPHTSASDAHPPAGWGAIRTHWSPRRDHAGTFDEAWGETRLPLMPADFDVRHNNAAHPSLLFEDALVPGDEIAVLGMSLSGLFAFALPRLPVIMRARFDRSGTQVVRPAIDTVLVEPGARRFEVTMRQAFPQGRRKDVLREICVDTDA